MKVQLGQGKNTLLLHSSIIPVIQCTEKRRGFLHQGVELMVEMHVRAEEKLGLGLNEITSDSDEKELTDRPK